MEAVGHLAVVAAGSAASAAEAGVLAVAARDRVGDGCERKNFSASWIMTGSSKRFVKQNRKLPAKFASLFSAANSTADPVIVAQKKFQRLGMHKTRERNAVLIFVAPRAHKFAVVGDKAIHEKCGEQFWQHVVDGMRIHFQDEKFSHALTEAISEVGKVLATHFPRTSADANELPDEIVES